MPAESINTGACRSFSKRCDKCDKKRYLFVRIKLLYGEQADSGANRFIYRYVIFQHAIASRVAEGFPYTNIQFSIIYRLTPCSHLFRSILYIVFCRGKELIEIRYAAFVVIVYVTLLSALSFLTSTSVAIRAALWFGVTFYLSKRDRDKR